MKKRTKKYNPVKHSLNEALLTLKNTCLLMRLDVSEGLVNAFNFVTKRHKIITQKQYKHINDVRFNWTIVLVIWSKESNGKERTATKLVQSPYPANHLELITSLNEQHQQIIAEEDAKGNTVFQAGWVAYPQELGILTDDATIPWINLSVEMLDLYKQLKV